MAKTMEKNGPNNGLAKSLEDVGWPLVMGLGLSALFYLAVFVGPLNTPFVHRYFAGHPVSFAATVMFWVGVSGLGLKLANVVGQFAVFDQVGFDGPPPEGQAVEEAASLIDALEEAPARVRNSYLGRRFRDAFEFVERKGAAEGIDDELKHLSDRDADRQHDGFALIRIIIWATPMLGFLGTVIGITQALGDLDANEMATSFESAMNGLLAGLYIAFDTTALALSLSIVLMFAQFVVDRAENRLLSLVDDQAEDEISGRFIEAGGRDPHVAAIHHMSERVVRGSEQLVQRQTDLWRETIDAAHQHWSRLSDATVDQLQTALNGALDQSLERCAKVFASAEEQAAEKAQSQWSQWLETLEKNAQILRQHQIEMARQSDAMSQAVTAAADIVKLENALNNNLSALAGAGNFEQTVLSLSAAIQLLSSRLGVADLQKHVDLQSTRQGQPVVSDQTDLDSDGPNSNGANSEAVVHLTKQPVERAA